MKTSEFLGIQKDIRRCRTEFKPTLTSRSISDLDEILHKRIHINLVVKVTQITSEQIHIYRKINSNLKVISKLIDLDSKTMLIFWKRRKFNRILNSVIKRKQSLECVLQESEIKLQREQNELDKLDKNINKKVK